MKDALKLIDYLVNDPQALAAVLSNCDCEVKMADENEGLTSTLLKLSQLADTPPAPESETPG
jgi:hypothetical protein